MFSVNDLILPFLSVELTGSISRICKMLVLVLDEAEDLTNYLTHLQTSQYAVNLT